MANLSRRACNLHDHVSTGCPARFAVAVGRHAGCSHLAANKSIRKVQVPLQLPQLKQDVTNSVVLLVLLLLIACVQATVRA